MGPVLFICDAGAAVGGGHVMRCLTLARALQAGGASCVFIETPDVRRILNAFSAGAVRRAPTPPGDAESLAHASRRLLQQGWEGRAFNGVVVDHYGFDAGLDSGLRGKGRRLLVLEDRAEPARAADLLLDASFGRTAEDYAWPSLSGAELMLGPGHALLRPEFGDLRPIALPRRMAGGPVRKVLVSMGLTDVGGVTGDVLRLVLAASASIAVTLVVGSTAPSLTDLRRLAAEHRDVAIRVDAADMAVLMAEADVAVGAGGSSTWERACLGLPSLTVILADNQKPQSQRLAAAGATLAVDRRQADFAAAFASAWGPLLSEGDLRRRLAQSSAALCDGRGAERVAEAFIRSMAG